MLPRIAITAGEPAGIGPDIIIELIQRRWPAELLLIADRDVLYSRAQQLGRSITLIDADLTHPPAAQPAGTATLLHVPVAAPVTPGQLSTAHAAAVLTGLRQAHQLCLQHHVAAVVTCPVHKGIINDAGVAFSGHTEFFADCARLEHVVMLLASPTLRVALVTTHLPLSAVSAAITPERLSHTLHILHQALQHRFGIANPHISVAGLNPHAGENGHLGHEEQSIILPVIQQLQTQGLNLSGPLPADTLFTPRHLAQTDCVLAMYHDQGLPTLKYSAFGNAVNVTLGLPYLRTSVDHGTALALAGTGQAKADSLCAAVDMALQLTPQSAQPRIPMKSSASK